MSGYKIPLARPDIGELEKKKVTEVLNSGYLSIGPRLPEFEDSIARYTGIKNAVAVSSGTAALHLIVCSLGIGAGDEVITTPFTFVSSANCILYENAKPVFVDIEPDTLNIDTDLIEAKINKSTKAIIAVDVFGHPADWDKLTTIANKHGLHLIEDSAEALGSKYKGKPAGAFGKAGVFAFYPNKQVATGEGGMVVTNDDNLAEQIKMLRNQGRAPQDQWLQHKILGYNYRLDEMSCAVGIAQMERIDSLLAKRATVAEKYSDLLASCGEITLPKAHNNVLVHWFVYVVRLSEKYNVGQRNDIISRMKQKGIQCSTYFPCVHLFDFYQKLGYKRGQFPVAENASEHTIALPFYTSLSDREIKYVVNTFKEALRTS